MPCPRCSIQESDVTGFRTRGGTSLPDHRSSQENRSAPSRWVAFAILSRKSGDFIKEERWLIDVRNTAWDDTFVPPITREKYDEDIFRRLAALNGWRLVKIIIATEKERWLYYERAF